MATMDNNKKECSLEESVRQFVEAQLSGKEPDIKELVSKYPDYEHQIRRKVKEFNKVDSLFDTLVKADQSDFVNISDEYDLIGKNVGSFEIKEVIGRGGMGVVYRAHDTRLDRSVAVKSIPAELHTSSTAQARFNREAKLLASLNHPNIAVIHDIIEEDKSGYLVLEYVTGQTLAERIARKPLKLQEALSIGQQIAEAISAAHQKGIIHRDLKPGNIKITPEGKVKVLDFGLAKVSIGEDGIIENTVTQPGGVIGTPAYMSPEQARGKPADKRSDIWAFGCIMYQMLTGQFPFGGETATDTLARIIERQPDWELLPQDIPMNIRTLLRRCLEKDPEHRPGEIAEAAVEISEALSKSRTTLLSKHQKKVMITGAMVIGIILSVAALKFLPKKEISPTSKEIRLVVLPFENLGLTEDEYFANGITDAITARLVGIQGLSVISRQSAIQYKKREKDTRQIAEELVVDYILEGTVQRERPTDPTSRVRIIPQLIKASNDTHVWTDIYDADMSKIFRLQSEVAERVAQALDITLLEPQRQAIRSEPTQNIEAYEYYLRGENYSNRSHLEGDKRIAIGLYQRAVELDPTFALAYTGLSDAHRLMYWYYYDRSNVRLAETKQAADKALELNPQLPEAHMALGMYFYHGHLDYDCALEQFEYVRKIQPNTNLFHGTGLIQRRQGKFEQALANIKKGYGLDPLNHFKAREVGTTFMYLRKHPDAERYYDRAISLAPDLPFVYYLKAWLYLCWEGNTEKARAILAEALLRIESDENPSLVKLRTIIDMFDRNYQKALNRLSLETQDIDNQEYIDDREYFVPNALLYARIYGHMDKKELAKKYYDEARSILESKIQLHHEHARFHSVLGIVYAGLGCNEDALREGKLGVELLPVSKDAMRGPYRVEDLARIYVMVGAHDEAINQLEYLLSIPGPLTIPLLRLDPAWDPLRSHPRFVKLLESKK
jgi:serine/threonine protein kinase/tetratricopeptide (TPR) repeat protein